VFKDHLFKEFEKLYGGMWDLEIDPIQHAHKMIAHIDKKRQALGIDKARERIMVDMADRRAMDMM
jgi:carbon-monoxide dehydrogenase catalytic subunit